MAAQTSKPIKSTPAFTTKDYVSITLSVIALTTSLLGFYFSNIRVEDNLHAKIVDVYPIRSKNGDTVVLSTVFINSGNRQAVLLAPWYSKADTTNSYDGATGAIFENDADFPLIMEPKQVKLIKLKISVKALNLNVNYSGKSRGLRISSSNDTTYNQYLQLIYYSYDSKYNYHEVYTGFDISISTTNKNEAWGVMFSDTAADERHGLPTDLFRKKTRSTGRTLTPVPVSIKPIPDSTH